MDIGTILPNSGALANPESIVKIAQRAERIGYSALWTSDHLVVPAFSSTYYPYAPGKSTLSPDHIFLDPIVVLANVAAQTNTIKLGVSVYLAALRNPIVAGKLIATLDQFSAGRLLLGVGAGWLKEEYEVLGISFSQRGRLLDECLEVLRILWSKDRPVHHGTHFQFSEIGFEPKPVDRHVPILVGGNSRAARRRVAKYGDGWHVIDLPRDQLDSGILDLERLCQEEGRPRDEINISMRSHIVISDNPSRELQQAFPLVGSKAELIDKISLLSESGVNHLALWPLAHEGDDNQYMEAIEHIKTDVVDGL